MCYLVKRARELESWLLMRTEALLIMTGHLYMYFTEVLVWPHHPEMGQ